MTKDSDARYYLRVTSEEKIKEIKRRLRDVDDSLNELQDIVDTHAHTCDMHVNAASKNIMEVLTTTRAQEYLHSIFKAGYYHCYIQKPWNVDINDAATFPSLADMQATICRYAPDTEWMQRLTISFKKEKENE